MLLGLWMSANDKQVRGVMVVGATALLGLAIWLTIYFIQQRSSGNTDAMLLTYSATWFAPLHICYSVTAFCWNCVYRYFCKLAVGANEKGIFPLVRSFKLWCIWLLHINGYVYYVHVL